MCVTRISLHACVTYRALALQGIQIDASHSLEQTFLALGSSIEEEGTRQNHLFSPIFTILRSPIPIQLKNGGSWVPIQGPFSVKFFVVL